MKNMIWAGLLLLSANAHSTPIFSAADPSLTGSTVITFEGAILGSYGETYNAGSVTFSNVAPAITPAIQGISIEETATNNHYLRYSTSVFPNPESSVSATPQVSLRIDFASPVNAFGLNVTGSYPYSLRAYNDSNILIETFGPTAGFYSNYFMGIASAENIKYAVLGNVNGFDYLQIDNLTFVPSSTVPVPAALPLMATALAIFGISRRKIFL